MLKIMIVEDHPIVREGLYQFFGKQHDMEVTGVAKGGLEALALLRDGLVLDILLIDLNMPEMDGLELTRQAVALNRDFSIIILTFFPLTIVRERAQLAGARQCLSKDGEINELLATIRSVHADQIEARLNKPVSE